MFSDLPSESYRIGVRWPGRPDDAATCAGQVVRMLEIFGQCEPAFDRWSQGGWTRREASVPFSTLPPQLGPMTRRLEIARCRDQEGRPLASPGFILSARGATPGLPAELTATIGCPASDHVPLSNRIDIDLSDPMGTGAYVPTAGWLKAVLLALVEAWRPLTGHVAAPELEDLAVGEAGGIQAGWMTYIAPSLARLVRPPVPVHTETTADGGLLLLATDERFDADNPQHLEGLAGLKAALTPLDDQVSSTRPESLP